jgi:hypothetical protein
MQRRLSVSPEYPGLRVPASLHSFSTTFPAIPSSYSQLQRAPDTPRDVEMSLPPEGIYPSCDALYEAIQTWSLTRGYAFIKGKSKTQPGSGRVKVYFSCDRRYKLSTNSTRDSKTQTRGVGCQFRVLGAETIGKTGWELKHCPDSKFGIHNHAPSTNPAAHPSYRKMPLGTRNLSRILHESGTFYTIS